MNPTDNLLLLKENFSDRYNKSDDRETLLNREIEAHEMLLDDKRLPLFINVNSSDRPLKHLQINYTASDIIRIREAFIRCIVNKEDLTGELCRDNNGCYHNRPPTDWQIHYFNEAQTRFSYLKWLQAFGLNENTVIDIAYLRLIYTRFKDWFPDENMDTWIKRFTYSSVNPIDPIRVEERVNYRGNNRLALIAILSAIQKTTGGAFNFDDFVFKRFGIRNFEKYKTDQKKEEKKGEKGKFFRDIKAECEAIYKKLTE